MAVWVFLVALASLSFGVWKEPVAGIYVDPVGKIAAQDEAVYSHVALRMANRNEFLTPVFLGRYVLFKPPLLYWACAASVKIFGASPFALRLPSLIAGALAATLLFLWMPDRMGGLTAAALLIADPFWRILSRLALTDAMLALWVMLAMRAIDRRRPVWFACATAAALMTKGIAGLMPMFILGAWWLIDSKRPSPWPWLGACIGALALASPWFLYQWWIHPKWFWAEFVQVEILGFSMGDAVPQTSGENHILFYVTRMLRTDPILVALCALGAVTAWRSGQRLLFAWLGMGLALVFANQYRNAAYLLPLIPAMCWIAAQWNRKWLTAALVAVAVIRTALPVDAAPAPSGPALTQYAAMNRARDLIIVEPDDQFAATVMPIRTVRYCFLGNEADYRKYALDFRHLGIALTVDEFLALDEARYRQRLREWGLDSKEPIGTVLIARDRGELLRLIAGKPDADFLVGENWKPESAAHDIRAIGSKRLLLAR